MCVTPTHRDRISLCFKLHFVCIITCIEAFITHENAINYTSKSAVIKIDWMNTRMVDSIHESLISDALPFSDAILLVAKEGPTGLRLTRMVTTYPSCFLLPRAWRENINTELRLWACLSTNVPFCTQILTRFNYFMKTKEEEKRIIFSGWKLLVQVSNLWDKTHNVVLWSTCENVMNVRFTAAALFWNAISSDLKC